MAVGFVLWRKMLHDVAAAVAEEFELLTVGTVGACQLEQQDIEVALQLSWGQAINFLLLPDLYPAGDGELERFSIEVMTVAQCPKGILVDLIAGNHPEHESGAIALFKNGLM